MIAKIANNPIFSSRVKSDDVTKAEKWLGYLVGPAGALLFNAVLISITGILLFTVPNASETVQVIWIMLSYNLFYSFAYTIFNMSHGLMVPLSTRNTQQRGGLSVFNQIATMCWVHIMMVSHRR